MTHKIDIDHIFYEKNDPHIYALAAKSNFSFFALTMIN